MQKSDRAEAVAAPCPQVQPSQAVLVLSVGMYIQVAHIYIIPRYISTHTGTHAQSTHANSGSTRGLILLSSLAEHDDLSMGAYIQWGLHTLCSWAQALNLPSGCPLIPLFQLLAGGRLSIQDHRLAVSIDTPAWHTYTQRPMWLAVSPLNELPGCTVMGTLSYCIMVMGVLLPIGWVCPSLPYENRMMRVVSMTGSLRSSMQFALGFLTVEEEPLGGCLHSYYPLAGESLLLRLPFWHCSLRPSSMWMHTYYHET